MLVTLHFHDEWITNFYMQSNDSNLDLKGDIGAVGRIKVPAASDLISFLQDLNAGGQDERHSSPD